jgi:hypothetical protein
MKPFWRLWRMSSLAKRTHFRSRNAGTRRVRRPASHPLSGTWTRRPDDCLLSGDEQESWLEEAELF